MQEEVAEIAQLRFAGAPYSGRTLDACALEELVKFQKALLGVAQDIWCRQNGAAAAPAALAEAIRFADFRFEDGAATVVVQIQDEAAEDVFRQGVAVICGALAGSDCDSLAPAHPVRLGSALAAGSRLQIAARPRTGCRRDEKVSAADGDDCAKVIGRVIEADFEQGCFRIQPDGGEAVLVRYPHCYEDRIKMALAERASMRLLVEGPGKFDAAGRLLEIERAEFTKEVPDGMKLSSRNLEDAIMEIAKTVPAEEWENVPTDLSARLDHYIYGDGFKKR